MQSRFCHSLFSIFGKSLYHTVVIHVQICICAKLRQRLCDSVIVCDCDKSNRARSVSVSHVPWHALRTRQSTILAGGPKRSKPQELGALQGITFVGLGVEGVLQRLAAGRRRRSRHEGSLASLHKLLACCLEPLGMRCGRFR